jgi:hypothetical protein
VLLSRGRDGIVVFVPDEEGMETTFAALVQCGLEVF